MQIHIKRTDADFQMEATNENGNRIVMDAVDTIGGHLSGMRPMQRLLVALGGCSAIDVLLILKKQKQPIDDFEVLVEGDREQIADYSIFRHIKLHFKATGNIAEAKLKRAIDLSLDKYCSVAKTLAPTAQIEYTYEVCSPTSTP